MAVILEHEKYGDISFPDDTTREELAQFLVELEAKSTPEAGALETLGKQAARSTTSSIRQVQDWMGVPDAEDVRLDAEREFESRVLMEQNPVTSFAGMLGGAVLDPVTLPALALKPLTFASKTGTFAARGAAQGVTGGLLEPIYEQYGDSIVANVMFGGAFGGALGAGLGKLASRYDTPAKAETVAEETKEASQKAVSNLLQHVDEPARTPEQALDKIRKELELEAAGAPTGTKLATEQKALEDVRAQINSLENVRAKLGEPKVGTKKQHAALINKIDNLKKQEAELDVLHSTNKTKRKAFETLEKVNKGKFSQLPDIQERIKAATAPLQKTPIAQAVAGQTPQLAPLRPSIARKLGIGEPFPTAHRSVGSAAVPKEKLVQEDLLPRATLEKTEKLVEGKYTGKNPETRVNVKESLAVKEAREEVAHKEASGQRLTEEDYNKMADVDQATEDLKGYKLFLQKVAGVHALDTAALRGFMKGRNTFGNIEAKAKSLLKRNGIEDFEDMIDFILQDPDRIFSAEEMAMIKPVLAESERKLFNAYQLLEHADTLSDAEIALIHNDINMYYGIQAWSKGQGSRASAALNYRRKMLQDIAEERMIDSLFLGIKC